jgi:hypothetical protein
MEKYTITEAEELELLAIATDEADEPIIYDELAELEADEDIISLFQAEAELGFRF